MKKDFTSFNGFIVTDEKATHFFNSVSDMKEYENIANDMVCMTLGYYEPNDGGGAFYRIVNRVSSEEDNGSVIFINDNYEANLIVKDGIVNVMNFGAKNGVRDFDSSPHIQNAIDFCSKISRMQPQGTYTCYVPNGTFFIADTLKIGENGGSDYINFEGNIVYTGERDKPAISIKGYDSQIKLGTISDVSPYGYGNYYNGYHGFENDNYIGVQITNLMKSHISIEHVCGFSKGVYCLSSADFGWNIFDIDLITNCKTFLKLHTTGAGWLNSNVFNGTSMVYFGNAGYWDDLSFKRYFIDIDCDGANAINSNVFNNFSLEDDKANNLTAVNISKFVQYTTFNNIRYEVHGGGHTFCELDCTYDESQFFGKLPRYIRFNTNEYFQVETETDKHIVFNNLSRSDCPLSTIVTITGGTPYGTDKKYDIVNYSSVDLTSANSIKVTGNTVCYKNISVEDVKTVAALDTLGLKYGISAFEPSTSSTIGFYIGTCLFMYLPLTLYQTLSFKAVGYDARFYFKFYDSNYNLIPNSENAKPVAGNYLYESSYNAYKGINNFLDEVSFSNINENVAYVGVFIAGNLKAVNIQSNKKVIPRMPNATPYFRFNVKPYAAYDSMAGSLVIDETDASIYYTLENVDGALSWVKHGGETAAAEE